MNAGMKVNAGKATMRGIAQATLLALLTISQPQAQTKDGTIARLRDLHGNVLVSNQSGLASGDEALRLMPGTRIITTANADVIVEYDNGCRVTLKENQRFEVEEGKPCAILAAQPYGIIVAAAAAPLLVPGLIVGAFGAAALGVLIDSRARTTASPS